MVDAEKVTTQAIEKGGILCVLYFDLHGADSSKLTNLGAAFINQLLKEPGVIYAIGEVAVPQDYNGVMSTSVHVKVLCKSFVSLADLCSKYSPFSIDILRPENIKFGLDQAHSLLMNIATTTFEYKKYIIEKVSSPQELEKYKISVQNKILMGKKLTEGVKK